MDQGWAAIIAAGAAGVFGIGGILLGIVVGRRQTTDQATVEHGHWLREQRLQAYTELFTAWDDLIRDLLRFQNSWNEQVESLQEGGFETHPSVVARRKTAEGWAALRPCFERAELLGPSLAVDAVQGLRDTWRNLDRVLENQGARAPFTALWEPWDRGMVRAMTARTEFHVAASRVLRTPPSPRGEALL